MLSHFRPGPDLLETRTALALCAIPFLIKGPAVRSLVALQRLPPAPPDTLVRAAAVVLGAAPKDRSALYALCDSKRWWPVPPTASSATSSRTWASWTARESRQADAGSVRAAGLHVPAGGRPRPDQRAVPAGGAGRGGTAPPAGGAAGAGAAGNWSAWSASGGARARQPAGRRRRRGGALAGADGAPQADEPIGTLTYGLGVRAEILLARGEVEAGLRLWRRAVDLLVHAEGPIFGVDTDPSEDQWTLEAEAVTVVARPAWPARPRRGAHRRTAAPAVDDARQPPSPTRRPT